MLKYFVPDPPEEVLVLSSGRNAAFCLQNDLFPVIFPLDTTLSLVSESRW